MAKRTIDEVKEIFLIQKCTLLENEYINNKTKMNYICSCGNPSTIRLNDFLRGVRCNNCSIEKVASKKRHDYEFIKKVFSDSGCTLLSTEYKNNRQLLDYICSCNNTDKITYDHFSRGIRCKKCGNKNRHEKMSHSFEYVKSYFEKENCLLLSTNYNNCMELLDYICSCGNPSKISFNNFQSGHRCYECSGKTSWDYGKVKQYFEDNGCVLLSTEYLTANDKLNYICECGNEHSIKFSMFQDGRRCKKCGIEKMSGENNPNWNGGISTILQYFRQHTLKWKKDSMFHSNYKCVITGKRFDVIHHLHGFDQIINEAFASLNITKREKVNEYNDEELSILVGEINRLHDKYPPGVCLTDKMHDEFHKIYGYGKNTPEQFYEFYRMKTGKEYNYNKNYINKQAINNAI